MNAKRERPHDEDPQVAEAREGVKDIEAEVKEVKTEVQEVKAEIAKAKKDKTDQSFLSSRLGLLDTRLNLLYELLKSREDRLHSVTKHKRRAVFEERETLFSEPRSISTPVSRVASSDINQRMTDGDVYHHWFALALYDLYKQHLTDLSTNHLIKFTFLSMEMSIPSCRLSNVIDHWIYGLSGSEAHMTAGLAVALERFLFPSDDAIGSCCHEMPLESSYTDRPDFCVLPYQNEGVTYYDCGGFVAVSDFKSEDFPKATIESFAYALKGSKGRHDRVRLVFPCTKHRVQLIVVVPQDKHLLSINVCDSKQGLTEQQLRIFLCMLYAGVHYLLKNRIKAVHNCLCPMPDLALFRLRSRSRVLVDEQMKHVYKLFDCTKDKPQLEAVTVSLPEAQVKKLSADERYSYLTYEYREGYHVDATKEQFHSILVQLQEIHEMGYVHSDIRSVNIVFGVNRKSAWIIDFDLADRVEVPYPNDYNHIGIPERHPHAQAGCQRQKIHDVFALDAIMTKCGISSILEKYRNHNQSLSQIAETLSNKADKDM